MHVLHSGLFVTVLFGRFFVCTAHGLRRDLYNYQPLASEANLRNWIWLGRKGIKPENEASMYGFCDVINAYFVFIFFFSCKLELIVCWVYCVRGFAFDFCSMTTEMIQKRNMDFVWSEVELGVLLFVSLNRFVSSDWSDLQDDHYSALLMRWSSKALFHLSADEWGQ